MKKYLLLLISLAFITSLKAQAPKDTMIYTLVDHYPSYTGGQADFDNFLRNNVRYPAVDKQNRVQGRVYVNFVVEKDGSLSNIKIIRTPSQTLAAETTRIMGSMPKWQPGIKNGDLVRVSYTIPINFAL